MNIAVIDDEEIIRQQIYGFIKKQKPESEIGNFSTGEELLATGRRRKPGKGKCRRSSSYSSGQRTGGIRST